TRQLDNQAIQSFLRTNTFNAISGTVGYHDGKKLHIKTSWEVRRDQDAPKINQWVTRNGAEYQLNRDWSFIGKYDYGISRFLEPHDTPASFTQLSTGFAYRPVDNDKLNILMRYTYLVDIANDLQFATTLYQSLPSDEKDHILSIDLAYDLYKYLG